MLSIPINNSETCLVSKLKESSLFDKPVCMTYYLEEGVKITASVIIKDKFSDHSGEFLVMANGTLIPMSTILQIYSHGNPEMPSDYCIVGSEEAHIKEFYENDQESVIY